MRGYSLFQGFNDRALAKQLTILFDDNDVSYQVINNSYGVDITFSNNKGHEEVQILIPNNSFDKAYLVLDKSLASAVAEADPDHYLFEFNNAELIDVIRKCDEWSRFDYLLARRIADERELDVDHSKIEELKNARVKDLATSKNKDLPLFIGGLMCVVFRLLHLRTSPVGRYNFLGLATLACRKNIAQQQQGQGILRCSTSKRTLAIHLRSGPTHLFVHF